MNSLTPAGSLSCTCEGLREWTILVSSFRKKGAEIGMEGIIGENGHLNDELNRSLFTRHTQHRTTEKNTPKPKTQPSPQEREHTVHTPSDSHLPRPPFITLKHGPNSNGESIKQLSLINQSQQSIQLIQQESQRKVQKS